MVNRVLTAVSHRRGSNAHNPTFHNKHRITINTLISIPAVRPQFGGTKPSMGRNQTHIRIQVWDSQMETYRTSQTQHSFAPL